MRKERTLSSGSIYLERLFRKQSEEVGVKHMGEKHRRRKSLSRGILLSLLPALVTDAQGAL